MRRNFALRPGYKIFLRKLAVAVPANLAIFWLLLHGDTNAVLLFGAVSALLGALLLMRLEGHVVLSGMEAQPATNLRERVPVHESARYAGRRVGNPRGVASSAGWLRER